MNNITTAREGASIAAGHGWFLTRLKAESKHPATQNWKKGVNDPDKVDRWFADGKTPNYGVLASASDLLILDEDEHGALDRFAADLGVDLPATFTVETAKGRHLYFAAEGETGYSQRGLIPGVDVRFDGYVVGPGSKHASGAVYTVLDGRDPAPVPAQLREYLTEVTETPSEPLEAPEGPSGPSVPLERLRGAIDGGLALLRKCQDAGEGEEPRWDPTVYKVACELIELSNTSGGEYSREDARADFMENAPRDADFGQAQLDHNWTDALRKVGDGRGLYAEISDPADDFEALPGEVKPKSAEPTYVFADSASWLFDQPDVIPARWGEGAEVLWAEGEALVLTGSQGTGKTTIAAQLVRALLGLQDDVLGYPVKPAAKVLYLAMDRPRQIARAIRRSFQPHDRQTVGERLVIWPGPPPEDMATNTELLHDLAKQAGADVVVVDSLKDAAIGLTEDAVGAGWNRARQTAIAAGVDVLELHHMIKKTATGGKPKALADVYGSTWITSGAGSVLFLSGEAGDAVVEMLHFKQPAEVVGPLQIEHDHHAGTSRVFNAADPLELLRAAEDGLSAAELAGRLAYTDRPNHNQRARARRQLQRFVRDGLAVESGKRAPAQGGTSETVYEAVNAAVNAVFEPISERNSERDPLAETASPVRAVNVQ